MPATEIEEVGAIGKLLDHATAEHLTGLDHLREITPRRSFTEANIDWAPVSTAQTSLRPHIRLRLHRP